MKILLHVIPALIFIMSLLCPGACPQMQAYALPAEPTGEEKAGDTAGGPDTTTPKIFGLEAGYNGSYAEGSSPKSYHSQPYLNISLKQQYVKFTAGISRFWDYQITNGEGKYESLNFTQPKLALSLYPHKVIEIFGEYRYWTGDKSHYYRANDGTAGFHLDFDVVNLGMSVNYNKSEYKFKSDDTESIWNNYTSIRQYIANQAVALNLAYRTFRKRNIHHTSELSLNPTLAVFVHETTSIDVSYDYQKSLFEYYKIGNQTKNEEYYLHSGKIGITSDPAEFFSLTADVSIGKDSQNYIIAGGDLGLTFYIKEYVSLSGIYTPNYYMPPPEKLWGHEVSRRFVEFREQWAVYNLVRWHNINPYMRLSKIGKPFWNHGVSVSAAFKY